MGPKKLFKPGPKFFYNLKNMMCYWMFSNGKRKQNEENTGQVWNSELVNLDEKTTYLVSFSPYWVAESLAFGGCSVKEDAGRTEISSSSLCYTVEAFWAIKAYLLHHSIVQDSNPHLNPLAIVFFQVTWLPPTLKTLLAIPTRLKGIDYKQLQLAQM